MTIGKKLYLLMGTAIAGLVLISAILISDIGKVYSAANYGNENTVPSLKVLADMTQRWSSMRISAWQHVALKDPATDAAMEAKYKDNDAKLEEAVAAYAPLLSDDKDKALYEFEKSELAYYRSLAQQAFDLSRQGKKAEAADLLMASQPRTAALIAKMSEHRDYNEALGKGSATDAVETRAKSVRNGTLIVALVTILLGAGSFLVIRSIRGGLARVIEHFEQIKAGNLRETIEVTSSDEVGRVLAALKETQKALLDAALKVEAAAAKAADDDGQLAAVSKAMATIEFELDGSVRTANDNFLSLLGYQLADIRGRHHSMFVDPAERDSADYRQFWERLRRGEYVAGRFRRIGQGNREAWLQASYNPIVDVNGKPYKVVKYATDVTQQVLMSQQLETAVRETQGVVTTAVEGNLVARIPMDGKSGDLGRLCGGVNTLLDAVSTLVEQVQGAAGEVHAGAEEISKGNVNLSQRTEEQASSLEETASSMEEMTSTVKQTADNAGQANQLAMAARQQAEKGGTVVGAAVTAMSQINASSKKIADIIGVIDEIAFQTNLLALNAAVEAARAGEQGRGFAVVASEVRNLAGRSAAAAKEIKTLINDSVVKVEEGSRLVDDSGRALGEIVTSVKKVTDIVSEIAAGTQEQSSGIEQVNKAVMQMDEATQQNAALVEQAAAASQAIVDQAQALNALVARYTVSATGKAARPAKAAAPLPERRSASRPWSPAAGARAAKKPAPAAAEAAPRRAAAGGGQAADSDWESF